MCPCQTTRLEIFWEEIEWDARRARCEERDRWTLHVHQPSARRSLFERLWRWWRKCWYKGWSHQIISLMVARTKSRNWSREGELWQSSGRTRRQCLHNRHHGDVHTQEQVRVSFLQQVLVVFLGAMRVFPWVFPFIKEQLILVKIGDFVKENSLFSLLFQTIHVRLQFYEILRNAWSNS